MGKQEYWTPTHKKMVKILVWILVYVKIYFRTFLTLSVKFLHLLAKIAHHSTKSPENWIVFQNIMQKTNCKFSGGFPGIPEIFWGLGFCNSRGKSSTSNFVRLCKKGPVQTVQLFLIQSSHIFPRISHFKISQESFKVLWEGGKVKSERFGKSMREESRPCVASCSWWRWSCCRCCRWRMMSDSRCGARGVQEEGGTQGGWRASWRPRDGSGPRARGCKGCQWAHIPQPGRTSLPSIYLSRLWFPQSHLLASLLCLASMLGCLGGTVIIVAIWAACF